jgi:hypothetical protein
MYWLIGNWNFLQLLVYWKKKCESLTTESTCGWKWISPTSATWLSAVQFLQISVRYTVTTTNWIKLWRSRAVTSQQGTATVYYGWGITVSWRDWLSRNPLRFFGWWRVIGIRTPKRGYKIFPVSLPKHTRPSFDSLIQQQNCKEGSNVTWHIRLFY